MKTFTFLRGEKRIDWDEMAFKLSLDGGKTWHTRFSTLPKSETS